MRDGMKYCIWGCGNRGKRIFRFMKGQGVCAFIDSNPELQGSLCQGVPVIAFERYQQEYRDCIVIISVFVEEEIREKLKEHQIPFFSAQMLPPEMVETLCGDLFAIAERRIVHEGTVYLYGLNLYSVLLAGYLSDKGRAVKIVPAAQEAALRSAAEKYMGEESFCSLRDVGDVPLYMTSNEYCMEDLPQKTVVELYDFLYDIDEYHKPYLEKYRDIHRGKRCFIIGNGPSLRADDLDKLAENNDICIGLNGIVGIYPSTKWRPTYYMVCGPYALGAWGDKLLAERGQVRMFMPDNIEYPNSEAFEIYHLSRLQADLHCIPRFSRDFSRGCYAQGVTFCALQMAAYMGFSDIYLYGMDFYYGKNNLYFTENYTENYQEILEAALKQCGDMTYDIMNKDMLRSKIAYISARRAMEEDGFRIYNASRRTRLDLFELVDFDSLFPSGNTANL